MTGFGRADGASGRANWYFEIRSVNGRGLDLRLRLPPGSEGLETYVREVVQQKIARGNVSVSLQVEIAAATPEIRVNEAALAQVAAAAERVRALTGGPPAAPEGLLALRGVLETVDAKETEAELQARQAAMVETLKAALAAFLDARSGEGRRLQAILSTAVDEIETLVAQVAASPARRPEAIAARLEELVRKLVGAAPSLEPDRLHQEAVLIATRADVEEELQRLRVHIAAARELIADTAPVGRRLDFLTQEFNREANTLCSKANDPDISRAGLAMKVLIDQMREQVANIE